ncbi:MAG: hypothetical protein SOY13_11260 [Pseudoflavonifractor sp.]|nr:hypothetical protein [Pseudoflavonifractor sp.]
MRKTVQRLLSFSLCLSIIANCSVTLGTTHSEVDFEPSSSNITFVDTSDPQTLVVKTDNGNTFKVVTTIENDYIVAREYINGLLSSTATAAFSECYSPSSSSLSTRALKYFGTVNYLGDTWMSNPPHNMSVKVYRDYTTDMASYAPPNAMLTLAQLVTNLVSVLAIPIGIANTVAGAVISLGTIGANGLISWAKAPVMSCIQETHTSSFTIYGNAPIYDPGTVKTGSGMKYTVKDANHPSINDVYYEGVVVDAKDMRTAESIYHHLFYYTDWDIVGWN